MCQKPQINAIWLPLANHDILWLEMSYYYYIKCYVGCKITAQGLRLHLT